MCVCVCVCVLGFHCETSAGPNCLVCDPLIASDSKWNDLSKFVAMRTMYPNPQGGSTDCNVRFFFLLFVCLFVSLFAVVLF